MYIIIVGCGRVGAQVGTLLSQEGHNVVIIDKKPEAFKRLGNNFNGITLIGNGFELDVLKEAGIERADAFCSLTNGDNTNIMATQVAKKIFGVPRVIARVYDSARAHIYESLGLEIISGTVLFAAMIRDKIVDKRLSSFIIETGDLGIIELDVPKALAGKTVLQVSLANEFKIITIVKGNDPHGQDIIIPLPDTQLDSGDKVYGIVRTESIKKVKEMFEVQGA
ncbi:MAG TPA: TrkA family potassium uptake protein [Candidatus Omnitrophota bacterium]|nr:TrkA family potassium uptake protein [Candidatus Omnitrophota bacterium]